MRNCRIGFRVLDVPNNKISLECKIKAFENMQNELNLLIFYFSLECDLGQVQSKRQTVAVAANRSHISFNVESSIISIDSSITDIIIRKIINL